MIIDKSMMRIFLDFECKYNTREQNLRPTCVKSNVLASKRKYNAC